MKKIMNFMKSNQSETTFNTKFKIFKLNSNNTVFNTLNWKLLTNKYLHNANNYR